ncbi:outer membrane protein with beta-barrel domain [Thermoflavifilum aggregans]|uniref:Outer membrane protein with beta-barrel domain n=1 Tax=Thermoflavifilum aggregans TaxID=454188 RepID=A0A2M9CV52_9BACT|nr:porin family protein [Thermoflavifilum aggregans]PJJ75776.1 outer membrane protein with beta-barrel domain [Thermoflavifilum aggregans]
MKRILLTASCMAIFATTFAQQATKPGIHLGIKADANLTKIDGQSYTDAFKLNYSLGAYAKLQISRLFALQPELNLVQSTSTVSNNFGDIYNDIANPDYRKNIRLNYLSIPLLASIGVTNHFFIQVGPQYGILMNDHENLIQNGKNAFKNGDFSMVGGVWIELPARLNVHARYVIGLSNINDIDNRDNWKSQAIQVGLGFTF